MAKLRRRKAAKSAAKGRGTKRSRGRRAVAHAARVVPPGTAPETQAVDMKDGGVEAALKSGEHSGLLEDYFGPAQYAGLKRLSQQAAQRGVRGGERVLILPGIMGSKLG